MMALVLTFRAICLPCPMATSLLPPASRQVRRECSCCGYPVMRH